ncbi:MAG: BT_3928 family protein [Bacteroidota bacterium]
MKIITGFFRVFVGCLLIFSGFIKANDTLGFSYKLVEYFEIFAKNIHFFEYFIPITTPLAIFLVVFEIALGFALLMGARTKLTLWLLFLLIVFFTFLTFYSAYFDKVRECGCFGDFWHLTPWQSFTKDLVLLVSVIILFMGKKYINPLFGKKMENGLLIFFVLLSTAFPLYTYNYLPILDFRAYAIGKNIPAQTKGVPDEVKFYYTLKDKKTGASKEFDAWPADWDKQYDYVSSRQEVTKKGIDPKIKDFSIVKAEGGDYTQDIIENPNYNFLLICYDLTLTNKEVFGKINDFVALCKQENITFAILTSSTKETIDKFKEETKVTADFYNTDGTVLKTMIRSNPGLILLKGGTVIDMWHYHRFPSFNDVKQKDFK